MGVTIMFRKKGNMVGTYIGTNLYCANVSCQLGHVIFMWNCNMHVTSICFTIAKHI